MKAVIVKNDQFETIGFEVTEDNKRIFSWGIAPQPWNFTKEIDEKKHFESIILLLTLEARISERAMFFSNMMDVLTESKIKINGNGYKMKGFDIKTQLMQEKITTIINKLI